MYLQITERCNMTCAHCAMSATREGRNMPMRTFYAALRVLQPGVISIGGGEPTLHPRFWEILMESKSYMEFEQGDGSIWLATNGSRTKIALALASLAKSGAIGCALSQDRYHDPIDPRVVKAFTVDREQRADNDCREIRNVDGKEIYAGRCDFGTTDRCVCPGLVVRPDGKVYSCGCNDAVYFGNVHDTTLNIPEDWDRDECWKSDCNRGLIT